MRHVRRTLLTATTALAAVAVLAAPTALAATPQEADHAGLQAALDGVVATGAVGALAEVRDTDGMWRGVSGVAELGTTRPVPTVLPRVP